MLEQVILDQMLLGIIVVNLGVAAAAIPAHEGRHRGGDAALVRRFRRCIGRAGFLAAVFRYLRASRLWSLYSSSGCCLSTDNPAVPNDECESALPVCDDRCRTHETRDAALEKVELTATGVSQWSYYDSHGMATTGIGSGARIDAGPARPYAARLRLHGRRPGIDRHRRYAAAASGFTNPSPVRRCSGSSPAAPLGFVLALSFGIERMSAGTATVLFWTYAAVMGLSLGSIFLVYTGTLDCACVLITAATLRSHEPLRLYDTDRSFGVWLVSS